MFESENLGSRDLFFEFRGFNCIQSIYTLDIVVFPKLLLAVNH